MLVGRSREKVLCFVEVSIDLPDAAVPTVLLFELPVDNRVEVKDATLVVCVVGV